MPAQLTVVATPSSVSTPPSAQVMVVVSGGFPPYSLSIPSQPQNVTVQVNGTGPSWSLIIGGPGSGPITIRATDEDGDVAQTSVQVN